MATRRQKQKAGGKQMIEITLCCGVIIIIAVAIGAIFILALLKFLVKG